MLVVLTTEWLATLVADKLETERFTLVWKSDSLTDVPRVVSVLWL